MYQSGMTKKTVLFFPWDMKQKGESVTSWKERQKIWSEDLTGDTDTNSWWLLAQMPKGEKKREIQREILAVC